MCSVIEEPDSVFETEVDGDFQLPRLTSSDRDKGILVPDQWLQYRPGETKFAGRHVHLF